MTERHLPAGRINPVTWEPMPAETKIVYRIGFYDADRQLVKHQEAWPEMDNPNLQMIADISAAGHQAHMGAGTVVAWEDADTVPPGQLPTILAGTDCAWRHFGPTAPPVPKYRYEIDSDQRTITAFPKTGNTR